MAEPATLGEHREHLWYPLAAPSPGPDAPGRLPGA
jgi:hypothetical protein